MPSRLRPALVMVRGAQARRLSIDLDISKAFAASLLTLRRKGNYYTLQRQSVEKSASNILDDTDRDMEWTGRVPTSVIIFERRGLA